MRCSGTDKKQTQEIPPGPSHSKPVVAGTGMLCLDVMDMENGEAPALSAGGYINTLIILQTRGWCAVPISLIGKDRAAEYVIRDLQTWNIDTELVLRRPEIDTPTYILHHKENGHFFGKYCPRCQKQMPAYSPLNLTDLNTVFDKLPSRIDVFYFDKTSEAAIIAARELKRQSCLIVFEPNRIEDETLFEESVGLSDILKYSSERRSGIRRFSDNANVPMEIETTGKEGLFYRTHTRSGRSGWRNLRAESVSDFKDAAGGGDWLTAALIDSCGQNNSLPNVIENRTRLEDLLQNGQRDAARNCATFGARGIMYENQPMIRGDDYCPHCGG